MLCKDKRFIAGSQAKKQPALRRLPCAAFALSLACLSCDEPSAPQVGTIPARIVLVSELAPSGFVAGSEITGIVFRVVDEADLPVPETEVAFAAWGGSSGVSPNPAWTDQKGEVTIVWRLGTWTGEPSVLRVRLPGSPSVSEVTITTTTIPGAVRSLAMLPRAATLPLGMSFQLRAGAHDEYANVVRGAVITWASSDPEVVSVSGWGVVTAIGPGIATITAQSEGATARTLVTVPVPPGPNGPGIPPFTMAVTGGFPLTILRSDGTTEAKISCGEQCDGLVLPNWSRDGRKLTVTGSVPASSLLFVANRDGTELRKVASADWLFFSVGKSTQLHEPRFYEDWSVDGRLVYVRTTRSAITVETIAADGTGRSTLMTSSEPIQTIQDATRVRNPRWGLGDTMISVEINGVIHGMNPDGTNLRPLGAAPSALATFAPAVRTTASGGDAMMTYSHGGEHTWSPDGRLIAFSSHGASPGWIRILDPVSGSVRQIAVPPVFGFCWSPSGSQFSVLTRTETSDADWGSIYTVNIDGTDLRRAVTAIDDASSYITSAWSPDGKFLVYFDDRRWSGGADGRQLYAQSLSEGTNTRLGDFVGVNYFSIAEVRGCPRGY